MLRLCIDARLYHASGIGTFLKAALASLTTLSKYQITLLCRPEDQEALAPFSHTLIPMKSAIYSASEQWEYRKLIPRCDLFWSPHFNVPLCPIPAQKRLVTIHDVFHLAHLRSFSFKEKIYALVMYQAAFTLSDTVSTISRFSSNEIDKYALRKPKKLVLLPPGFDHFNSPEVPLGKKEHLLFVGNLKPHKNLARLVQAYDQLRPEEPLFLVGKKEKMGHVDLQLMREIEKSSYLRSQVHLTGYVEEDRLKELYAGAKLFIFPSLYEGFGYPPLEAMAYGCPVVASRAASIPEVCEDAAAYVDPFSLISIADGIGSLLSDGTKREELVRKGKRLFEKKKKEENRIAEVIDACCRSS